MGKFLILVGILVVVIGCCIHFQVSIPWIGKYLGRLPGDLLLKKGKATIYFPFTTSILLSIILSLLLSLFFGRGR